MPSSVLRRLLRYILAGLTNRILLTDNLKTSLQFAKETLSLANFVYIISQKATVLVTVYL